MQNFVEKYFDRGSRDSRAHALDLFPVGSSRAPLPHCVCAVNERRRGQASLSVPEGPTRIDRRFKAGSDAKGSKVPQGRPKSGAQVTPMKIGTHGHPATLQPSLRDLGDWDLFPALKRRAIFSKSLRDGLEVLQGRGITDWK